MLIWLCGAGNGRYGSVDSFRTCHSYVAASPVGITYGSHGGIFLPNIMKSIAFFKLKKKKTSNVIE